MKISESSTASGITNGPTDPVVQGGFVVCGPLMMKDGTVMMMIMTTMMMMMIIIILVVIPVMRMKIMFAM